MLQCVNNNLSSKKYKMHMAVCHDIFSSVDILQKPNITVITHYNLHYAILMSDTFQCSYLIFTLNLYFYSIIIKIVYDSL